MDGRTCGIGEVPAVASDGASSTDTTRGTDVLLLPLPEKQSTLDGASRQAQNANGSLEAGMRVDVSKSAGSAVKKDLQKCATFPSSAGEAGQEEDSCCDADADAPTDAHAYQRSVSLPAPVKLISAMKGSREKNGLPSPRENPHIKWAEDVYDPPVTSVSHSVNNNSYKRRPNPRKKDKSKQKQKQKGRSKKKTKNANQNPAVTPTPPGLEDDDLGTSIGREAPADPGEQGAEFLDYGISGSQDAKCGSSFLLETVAKMHFSTAEAS